MHQHTRRSYQYERSHSLSKFFSAISAYGGAVDGSLKRSAETDFPFLLTQIGVQMLGEDLGRLERNGAGAASEPIVAHDFIANCHADMSQFNLICMLWVLPNVDLRVVVVEDVTQ